MTETAKINQRRTGNYYEKKAGDWLRSQGFEILGYNFRCRQGEIDIVSKESGILVFTEVKYRSSTRTGSGQEAVTARKQRTICRVADYYRVRRGIPGDMPCRFDVLAVSGEGFSLLRNAFPYIPPEY